MKSKIKNSIFVIATSLASAAFFSQTATAGESGYPVLQSISEKTTAQVKEELRKAKESGELSTSDSAYPILESAEAPKTRSEVKAELKQARLAKSCANSNKYTVARHLRLTCKTWPFRAIFLVDHR